MGEKTSFWRVLASTLAAFVGIQNDQNRERDFQQKSIVPFMLVGVVLATLFIVALIFIATQIDPSQG